MKVEPILMVDKDLFHLRNTNIYFVFGRSGHVTAVRKVNDQYETSSLRVNRKTLALLQSYTEQGPNTIKVIDGLEKFIDYCEDVMLDELDYCIGAKCAFEERIVTAQYRLKKIKLFTYISSAIFIIPAFVALMTRDVYTFIICAAMAAVLFKILRDAKHTLNVLDGDFGVDASIVQGPYAKST